MKAYGFLAVAIAATVVAAFLGGCSNGTGSSSREVAALVNGERIYFDDVNEEYASLSTEQQESITRADALSFLIEREILAQEAKRQGVTVSEKEVEDEYEFLLLVSNLTGPGLELQLRARNSSLEKFKATVKKQVMIGKLLDKAVPRQFIIKHDDVERIYNASNYASLGITFEHAEKAIVDLITGQRQASERAAYIERLKGEADVLIVAVPG
ncbi:SurA N-terminal domain-containing protein [Candidatus Woesearchaeota archaeon]|nr:SurA N-terminal domain-containing protein [Candidatus Woesearchaeota archaeon]